MRAKISAVNCKTYLSAGDGAISAELLAKSLIIDLIIQVLDVQVDSLVAGASFLFVAGDNKILKGNFQSQSFTIERYSFSGYS